MDGAVESDFGPLPPIVSFYYVWPLRKYSQVNADTVLSRPFWTARCRVAWCWQLRLHRVLGDKHLLALELKARRGPQQTVQLVSFTVGLGRLNRQDGSVTTEAKSSCSRSTVTFDVTNNDTGGWSRPRLRANKGLGSSTVADLRARSLIYTIDDTLHLVARLQMRAEWFGDAQLRTDPLPAPDEERARLYALATAEDDSTASSPADMRVSTDDGDEQPCHRRVLRAASTKFCALLDAPKRLGTDDSAPPPPPSGDALRLPGLSAALLSELLYVAYLGVVRPDVQEDAVTVVGAAVDYGMQLSAPYNEPLLLKSLTPSNALACFQLACQLALDELKAASGAELLRRAVAESAFADRLIVQLNSNAALLYLLQLKNVRSQA